MNIPILSRRSINALPAPRLLQRFIATADIIQLPLLLVLTIADNIKPSVLPTAFLEDRECIESYIVREFSELMLIW